MKQILLYVCLFLAIVGKNAPVKAQCPDDNTLLAIDTIDCGTGFETLDTCFYGGSYALVYVTEGYLYTFRTCGDEDFDTEITLRSNLGVLLGYNDDACEWQSSANWLATFTGYIRVLVDRFPCGNQSECMRLQGACNDPCDYSIPYTGDTIITTCSGTICDHGGNDNYGPSTNGSATIVPTISGKHIQLTGMVDSEYLYDYIAFFNGYTTSMDSLISGWWGSGPLPTITSSTGPITIQFFADATIQYSGFSLNIACVEPVSIDPVILDGRYIVWPNPNDGNFNLQFSEDIGTNVVISIIDNSGMVYLTQNIVATGSNQIVSFNGYSQLSPGMYFVRIQGKSIQTFKIVVQ